MSVEQQKERIVSNIWRALAQSGVNLAAIPHEKQVAFVDALADQLLVTLDSLLDEVSPQVEEPTLADEHTEEILWEGRPFLSLAEKYVITSERLKIRHGFLGHNIENFELIRIQDIDYTQGVGERMLGMGDIAIRGHDPSNPEIVLRNIAHPEDVYEILRRAWLEARKRYGLQFREQM
jgi:hypothetical protein